jgi:hypothetical protein
MPQKLTNVQHRQQHTDWTGYDWTDYDRLTAEGNSRRVIAKRLGIPLTTLPRGDKAHQSVPVNGDHGASTILPQRIEIVGAPLSASAHSDAPARISPPIWVNRGTHLAADMLEAVKTYTQQHRLEMRELIDTALRRFFEDGER